jgi:hypothetical protein
MGSGDTYTACVIVRRDASARCDAPVLDVATQLAAMAEFLQEVAGEVLQVFRPIPYLLAVSSAPPFIGPGHRCASVSLVSAKM